MRSHPLDHRGARGRMASGASDDRPLSEARCRAVDSGAIGRGLRTSRVDEGKEVRVDRVGVGGEHAVREAGVDLQSGVLDELRLEERGTFVRNNLVVVPLNYQRWYVDTLQVLSQVRFRECLDAIVVGLGATHHALAPPVIDYAIQWFRALPVIPVEDTGREVAIKLRAVLGQALTKAIEHLDRQAARVVRRLHHDRRNGGRQHQLREPTLAVTRDITCGFAPTGGVADMNSLAQVQMFDDCGRVGGVVVHIVTVRYLARASVAATIDSHDTVAALGEKQHLAVPVVAAQRPPVMKDNGLALSPVLVENLNAVFGGNCAHDLPSYNAIASGENKFPCSCSEERLVVSPRISPDDTNERSQPYGHLQECESASLRTADSTL